MNLSVNVNVYTAKQISLPRLHQQTCNSQRTVVVLARKIYQMKIGSIVAFSIAHQKWKTSEFSFGS